ncbi:MAG: trypsin-like peptidase domain-containing protein, partial [Bdellovibrionales bacterium]|nr:trypsin-like peptidase domain-containing protein [Bdellovibrionales bacterium]
DSAKVEVGQKVLAIGNPHGLDRTLTMGIVSSLNRTVKNPNGYLMKGLVQTDAAINPGNSGGPLIDLSGRLIGMNTAILSKSGDSAGIGFAVPINQIRRVLPELVATGKVLRPEVGWILLDTERGPMVFRVQPGSPAEQAGIQPIERTVGTAFLRGVVRDFSRADVVVEVNGQPVYSREDVDDVVSNSPRGASLTLTLQRGGDLRATRKVTIKPVLR